MFSSLSINFYPTLVCNLSCNYCMVDKTKSEVDLMTLDTVDRIMRKTVGYKHIHLGYVGGEPLLVGSDYFKKLYERAVQHCKTNFQTYSSSMITNGTLLTPEFIEWADSVNLEIYMSYDGKGKRHPHTKKMLPYIAKIQEKKSDYAMANSVIMVVSENNIDHLVDAIDTLVANNISKVCTQIDINLSATRMPYFLERLKELWDYINDNQVPINVYTFMDLLSFEKSKITKFPKFRFNEEFGRYSLGSEVHVYPDEQVRPCMPSLNETYKHLKDYNHLSDYFYSPEYQSYISKWLLSMNIITGDAKIDEYIRYTRGGAFIFDKPAGGVGFVGHNIPRLRLMIALGEYISSKPITQKVYQRLL